MPKLSKTSNSLSYSDGHTNITLSKNSITLNIDYKKEILEVSGKDILTGYVNTIHLYGNIKYSGIEEYTGQKDPEAPKGTSQNFQELTTFIKQFAYYTHESPDSITASCVLDNHTGKFAVSSDSKKGSILFDANSIQIIDKALVITLSQSTKFRKVLGAHVSLNKPIGSYMVSGHYDKGFYITFYNQTVSEVSKGNYNLSIEVLDPRTISEEVELSVTLILVP